MDKACYIFFSPEVNYAERIVVYLGHLECSHFTWALNGFAVHNSQPLLKADSLSWGQFATWKHWTKSPPSCCCCSTTMPSPGYSFINSYSLLHINSCGHKVQDLPFFWPWEVLPYSQYFTWSLFLILFTGAQLLSFHCLCTLCSCSIYILYIYYFMWCMYIFKPIYIWLKKIFSNTYTYSSAMCLSLQAWKCF